MQSTIFAALPSMSPTVVLIWARATLRGRSTSVIPRFYESLDGLDLEGDLVLRSRRRRLPGPFCLDFACRRDDLEAGQVASLVDLLQLALALVEVLHQGATKTLALGVEVR